MTLMSNGFDLRNGASRFYDADMEKVMERRVVHKSQWAKIAAANLSELVEENNAEHACLLPLFSRLVSVRRFFNSRIVRVGNGYCNVWLL
jgi:hypothetical protein